MKRDTKKNPALVASKLVSAMGLDNGCQFVPSSEQLIKLSGAAELMLKAGVDFSDADVELITGGEISEAGCAFGKVAGWDELNSALNDIFEGV